MDKLKIAVEPDGVVYDIFTATRNQLLKSMNLDWASKGLKKYPMPDPATGKSWDIPEQTFLKVAAAKSFQLFSQGSFLPRAQEAIQTLVSLDGYEVFFLTTPRGPEGSEQWSNALEGKKKWLAQNGLGHIRLETCSQKTPFEHQFDALIDCDGRSLKAADQAGATTIGVFSKATQNTGFPRDSIDFLDLFDAVQYLRYA